MSETADTNREIEDAAYLKSVKVIEDPEITSLRAEVERLNKACIEFAADEASLRAKLAEAEGKMTEERAQSRGSWACQREVDYWTVKYGALSDKAAALRGALGPFANMLPDDVPAKDALTEKLKSWCKRAREALASSPTPSLTRERERRVIEAARAELDMAISNWVPREARYVIEPLVAKLIDALTPPQGETK